LGPPGAKLCPGDKENDHSSAENGFRFDASENVPDLPQIVELAKFHGVPFATEDSTAS
jgi:hypothetical protein